MWGWLLEKKRPLYVVVRPVNFLSFFFVLWRLRFHFAGTLTVSSLGSCKEFLPALVCFAIAVESLTLSLFCVTPVMLQCLVLLLFNECNVLLNTWEIEVWTATGTALRNLLCQQKPEQGEIYVRHCEMVEEDLFSDSLRGYFGKFVPRPPVIREDHQARHDSSRAKTIFSRFRSCFRFLLGHLCCVLACGSEWRWLLLCAHMRMLCMKNWRFA